MSLAAVDPIVGIIVVAVAGPLVTYLVAVRRLSGKVGSSDASELWAESRSIREWSKDRIAELNTLVGRLEGRVGVVENQNLALARENENLVQQIRGLSDTITELRAEIVALTAELQKSHERVAELEDEQDDAD
jgi:chromosome segregation ATPase